MPKIVLKAILPRDRMKSGWLIVEIDGMVKDDFPVLGRGQKNRGELDRNGDTPTGTYIGTFEPTGRRRSLYSYGPNGVIRLEPTGGDALLAKQRNDAACSSTEAPQARIRQHGTATHAHRRCTRSAQQRTSATWTVTTSR